MSYRQSAHYKPTFRTNESMYVKRTRTAMQWIREAGCTHLAYPITNGADKFAGADHDAYLAYVSWKVVAYKIEQENKQVARGGK